MRMLRLLLLYLIILILNFNLSAKETPTKHALVIAVGEYPKKTGWSHISSNNDVPIIVDALLRQGFENKNISVIIDKEAHKQNILSQLQKLTNNVKPGDIVVIHFSGHGQQIMDDDGDEPDGYDESLIPFDAMMRYSDKYKGENHIRDDELRALLTNLRLKLGKTGNVLVILDSCHSGTATRGYQKSRGTQVKFQPPGHKSNQSSESRGLMDMNQAIDFEKDELASMVTFSASSPEQLNYEFTDKETGVSYGSLSFAVSKAFTKVDSATTYRGLFDRILVEMSGIAPKQNPQAEGDLDLKLFGGEALTQAYYFKIKEKAGDRTYKLNGGHLMGLFDGAQVGFYDINTYDFLSEEPKTIGSIINSTSLEADVILEKEFSEEEAANFWIYITEQAFGDIKIKVRIGKFKNNKFEKQLKDIFNSDEHITLTNDVADIIIESNSSKNSDSIFLFTNDDLLLASISRINKSDIQIEQFIKGEIKSYFQANFLRSLELSTSEFKVSFEIIPITIKKHGSTFIEDQRLLLRDKMNPSNQLEFKEGDYFKIIVRCDGYNKAFYQILDIQPDNKINMLIPSNENKPADYIIYPGEEKELHETFVIGRPYGNEVFKLIATSEPLDLSIIVQTRGEGQPESRSPFEVLFRETYNQTRGATLIMSPEEVSIYSLSFKIVE